MKKHNASKDSALLPRRQSQASRTTFVTGLLSGAAISTLVPWEALETVAPGARLACVATLGAAFVTFRLFFFRTQARRVTSIAMVGVGGFLMSAGPKVLPGALAISPVGVGAACFLFGITLLMRERHVPHQLREEAVERLLEDTEPETDAAEADELNTTRSIERLQALQLLAEVQAEEDRMKLKVGP